VDHDSKLHLDSWNFLFDLFLTTGWSSCYLVIAYHQVYQLDFLCLMLHKLFYCCAVFDPEYTCVSCWFQAIKVNCCFCNIFNCTCRVIFLNGSTLSCLVILLSVTSLFSGLIFCDFLMILLPEKASYFETEIFSNVLAILSLKCLHLPAYIDVIEFCSHCYHDSYCWHYVIICYVLSLQWRHAWPNLFVATGM